ncbi:MAG: YdeI/OmpD-associated family protein [archaeon]
MKDKEGVSLITVYTFEDWRNWLEKNHLTEKKVGIIIYKKHTGKKSISHREAMHEAICFGWIDTTIKRLDDEKFVRYFVKRGDKANWSKNTLRYGKELLKKGRMAPQGVLRYKQGLLKKPHDHGIPANPRMPRELKNMIKKNNVAKRNFELFSPSTKRMFYRWILRAKSKETKDRRMREIVQNAVDKNKNLR